MQGKASRNQHVQELPGESGSSPYHALFEHLLDGLAYCKMEFDASARPVDFVYLEVNAAFEELTGLRNVVGKRITELIPGIRASNPELFEIYGRVARTGQAEKFETRVAQLDTWFSVSVHSPANGYFVAVFENITEYKRTAQALEHSERRSRALIENSLDQISLLGADGSLLWENPSALGTLGYALNEHVGRSIFGLVHPDDLEPMQRDLAGLVAEPGSRRTSMVRFRHANGSWRWIEGVATNRLQDPAIQAIVLNYRDVSERRNAEEDLKRSEEQYRQLFENNPHPMWLYDQETLAFLAVNDAAIESYGYSREEFLRMTIRDIRPEQEVPRLMENLSRPIAPMRISDGSRHRRKDGTLIDVSISSHSVDVGGRLCALVLAQDVTETKQAEARIRYLTRVYATISHVNQAIVRVQNREELTQKICDVAVQDGGFRLAWIGFVDGDTGHVLPVAHAGYDSGYLDQMNVNVLDPTGGNGPTGTAIRTGQAVFVENLATRPNAAPWSKPAVERGYRSYAAVPIRHNEKVTGVLALYAEETNFFNQEEMQLLEEIGLDISFALDAIELEENRRRLAAERSQLIDTIERSLNEIYMFDPHTLRFEYANRGALHNLGYTADEMQLLTPLDIKPEFTEAAFREKIAPLECGEQEQIVFETVHRRADASVYPVEVHLQMIEQDSRKLYLAIILDISARKQAEVELEATERRYRNVLSSMMEGCQIVDFDWRWIYINDTAAQQLSHQPTDLLMQRVTDVFPEFATADVFSLLQACMHERRSAKTELEIRLPNRPARCLELSVQPVPEGLFVLSIDITERRQAELAHQNSERRFRKFFELGVIGMTMTAADKGFAEANDRLCEMLGYSRDEIRQLTWEQLTYPPDLALDLENFDRLLNGELDGYSIEKRFVHKSGQLIHTALSVNAVRDGNGKLEYCAALLEDITDRKKAEQELKASEEKYRSLFNNVPVGVYSTSPEGEFLAANTELVKMLGFDSLAELQETNVRDLYAEPQQRPQLLSLMRGGDAALNLEVRLKRKDGREITVLDNGRAVQDEQGDLLHFEGTLTDITARKQAEDALRLENERFQRFVESNIVGITIADAAGQILVANDYYLELLGASRDDLLAGRVSWRDFTPGEWLPADERAIQQLRERGVCEPYEKEYQRADGTRVPVYLADTVLPGPGGQIAAFVLNLTQLRQAEKRSQQQLRRITGLREVDRAITSSFDLRISMNSIVEQVERQLGADASAILTLDLSSSTLNCIASRGFSGALFGKSVFRMGEGLAGSVVMAYQTMHYPDLRQAAGQDPRAEAILQEGLTEYYGVPLISKGQVKGVLELFYRAPHPTDRESLEYLETLAGQAAIAIDNIQMLDGLNRSNLELIQAYDATIEGWSRALDLRDKETEGHTRRVTELTIALARHCGIGEQDLTNIRWGALLHDIGKMGVPDSILLKPGPLTEDEWAQMKKHPQFAYEMLAPIHYLRGALDIPLCHHEKWDGSGYPAGLKERQIPLTARIFAIVDIWDALRSDRPYRPAWPEAKALDHIRALSGTHLDPQVVQAFFDHKIFQTKW
jgi:PAS domain S-box-containing protein